MLVDWNATSAPVAEESSLTALLERQAAETPDAVAVTFEDSEVSYRELHESANALAEQLVRAGRRRGHDRRARQRAFDRDGRRAAGDPQDRCRLPAVGSGAACRAAALHGVRRPTLPAVAGRFARRSSSSGLATDSTSIVKLAGCLQGALSASAGRRASCRAGRSPPTCSTRPGRPAPQRPSSFRMRPCVSMLSCATATGPDSPQVAGFWRSTTISFDIAAAEIWLPLVLGERMVLAHAGGRHRPEAARGADPRRAASPTCRGPRPLSRCWSTRAGRANPSSLSCAAASTCRRRSPSNSLGRCRLWNGYGPTETTVYCTAERIHGAGRITIGRPIANARAYLLDRRDRPVPVGRDRGAAHRRRRGGHAAT